MPPTPTPSTNGGVEETAHGLFVRTHVAPLPLPVPPGADLLLEIGASDRNTLDTELLPQLPKAFLVSFEP